MFTAAYDCIGNFESLYVRILHDAAGHLMQSLLICWIVIKEAGVFDLAPAFAASLLDLDHFVTARSFSLVKATSLIEQAPLHNLLLPLGVCISTFVFKRFAHTVVSKLSHTWAKCIHFGRNFCK